MEKKIFYSVLSIVTIIGCKPTFEVPEASKGNAPISSYVSIGSSYTAGFADGALSKEGQAASFPKLIAERFSEVGGGNFNIPYLTGSKGAYPDPLASNIFHTLSRLSLKVVFNCKGEEMLLPQRISDIGDDDIKFDDPAHRIYTSGNIYHHFGIPGMKSFHAVLPGYAYDAYFEVDLFNPYFWRFASGIYTPLMQDVMTAKPSFYTLEIGMSDVMNYAIDGGIGKKDGTLKPDLTSSDLFKLGIKTILDSMQNKGAKGIIANIPDVLDFPYFRRIQYNSLEIDATKAVELNSMYASDGLTFSAGKNPFVIKDNGKIRQLKSTELITLKTPVDSLKCANWGGAVPIEDIYILTEDEIALIGTYTGIYNNLIIAEAQARGISILDLKDFFQQLKSGITVSGIDLSTEFVKGGFFSLDGLHPTPRGQAMIANEFITMINKEYSATLALYDISGFQGAVFP